MRRTDIYMKFDPSQSQIQYNMQSYQEMLNQELFQVEEQAQYQSAWFMLASVLVVYSFSFADSLTLTNTFQMFIHIMVGILCAWFLGTVLIIKKGYYVKAFKFVNVIFQVSMVSFFLMISARIMGVEFALSSVAPMFYVVVIGVSSMTLNPFLCLLAGGFAAGQFLGMYAFWLHGKLDFSQVDPNLFGWPAMLIHAVLFLIMGIVAMYMARKARSLLETVIVQVRYEEQLKLIERDIEQAAEVQQHLIPSEPPRINYLEIETFYSPSRLVGGDYLDYIERPNDKYLIVIGDVSGKGIAAAMMMSSIQAMMHLYAQQDISLSKLMQELNNSVYQVSSQGRFVSMVCFEFDKKQSDMLMVNCGHNAPMLVTAKGDFTSLDANYPVIGVEENQEYSAKIISFNLDDLLFAYTDGLSELRRQDHSMFGVQAIEAIIKRCCEYKAKQLKQMMIKNIQEYLQDDNPTHTNDDLSFVCVRKRK